MTEPDELFDTIRSLQEANVAPEELVERVWRRFGLTRAVLVLDSSGFTRVTHSHGIVHYLGLIARLRTILCPVFESHGSLRERVEADNVFAEFHGVDEALEAAVAANAAVANHGLMLTDTEPFGICIGIGYGELLRSGPEGLFGAEMNVASKLGEDTAEPREILLTVSAHAHLSETKQAGFEERFVGISGNAIRYYWMHWHA